MRLRGPLSRLSWAALAVLVAAIAGATHIVSLLAFPWRSPTDAFARIAAIVPPEGRATLGGGSSSPPFVDPALRTDICRFDLGAAPFRLSLAPFPDRFVTIGFHGRHGIAFYGLTVQATDESDFDLVLSRKADAGGDSATDQDTHKVVVVAPEAEGFVSLATPRGDGSEAGAAEARLARMGCKTDAGPPG